MNAATTRTTALGRAELTLLVRNKTALTMAVAMPVVMIWLLPTMIGDIPLEGTGLGLDSLVMTGGIGFVLLFAVYYNLVTTYVARREELVLKRLRTGEPRDLEILAGTALPSVAVALLQCVALVATGALLMDMTAPRRPELLVTGLLLGVVMLTALAAATTVFTKNVEIAQLTTMPLLMLSMMTSGLFLPLEVFPDLAASIFEFLPLSPVVELVRAGWLGGVPAYEVLKALAIALAWTVTAVAAAQRWFRWDPRH